MNTDKLRELLAKAVDGGHRIGGMRVFVTSKERIKKPEGDALFDESVSNIQALHSALPELLDELGRLRKDVGWQPIETAQRDGTLFVARIQWSDEPVVGYFDGNRFYVTNEHHEVSCGTYCYGGSIGTASGTNPTHWMPLPAPPAIDAAIAAQEGMK